MLKKRRFEKGDAITIICENTDNYGNICGNGTITFAIKDEFECNVPLTLTYYCDRCKREMIVMIQDTEIVSKSTNNLRYGNYNADNTTTTTTRVFNSGVIRIKRILPPVSS